MRKLLTTYKVAPDFLNVLFSFGQVPDLAESGSKYISCTTRNDGSRGEVNPDPHLPSHT